MSRTYAETKLEGSARMHSFVDIGRKGSIRWRERSCHQCKNCFEGRPSAGCALGTDHFGRSETKAIVYPAKPETSLSRVLRSVESKSVKEMISEVVEGQFVCVAMPRNEHEPWMLGRAEGMVIAATPVDVREAALLGFDVKEGAEVLRLQKFEPFDMGSRRYIKTKVQLVVLASRLRRYQLQSNSSPRLTAKMKADSRYGDATFELKEADVRIIVALMASDSIGSFKVASIDEHRTISQRKKVVDQFLVRWEGWDREEDKTWEPLAHFSVAEHLTRCEELKQASLTSTNNAPSAADASSSTGQSLPTDVSLFADVSFDLFVDSSSPPTDMSRIYFADLWCPTNVLDASIPADTSFSTDAPLSIDASSPVDTSSPAGTSCIVPNDPPMSIAPATTATTAPPIIPPGAKYNSLSEMLSLAQLKVVPVEGDGNCGFYSFLTSKGNKIVSTASKHNLEHL